MTVFNEPTKWAQSLGATANADVIPDEAGATDVDISKIFPAVFSVPLSQGGKAIPRKTLNGLLKLLGDWLYYYQQGGAASYSNTIDYVPGRVVFHNSSIWQCLVANGADDPQEPIEGVYWTEVLTLASVVSEFADVSFSNVNNTASILMAHNAMPSTTYDTLTAGASGTTYTAPADGYFYLNLNTATSGTLYNRTNSLRVRSWVPSGSTNATQFFMPVKKGDIIEIIYNGSINNLWFIYAVGSKSEQ